MTSSSTKSRMTVLVAAVLAFGGLVFVPAQKKLKAARAEARTILDTTTAELARYGSLEQLQREVQLLRVDAASFDRRIPPDHRLGDFLRDLTVVLQQSGLQNHIFQPRPVHGVSPSQLPPACVKDFSGIQVQPILVQCEGRFGGLFDALAGLEQMERLSRLASLNVTADPKTPGRVKVEMLLDTFFLPAATTGGSKAP